MIDVRRTIDIEAPVRECYRYWTYFERFPSFMPPVKRVCYHKESDTWEWEMVTPDGKSWVWHAIIDAAEPNRWIVLRSAPNEPCDLRVTATFDEIENFWTRLTIAVTYYPPAETAEPWSRNVTAQFERCIEQGLQYFQQLMMKQPAAVKSQSGLSGSGSMQGMDETELTTESISPGVVNPARTSDSCRVNPFESETLQSWSTGIPKPHDDPGDVPSIAEEYTTFGVTKYPPRAEQKTHELNG